MSVESFWSSSSTLTGHHVCERCGHQTTDIGSHGTFRNRGDGICKHCGRTMDWHAGTNCFCPYATGMPVPHLEVGHTVSHPVSNPCTKLTAITGTWSDLERHARYVYENADEQSSEWMLSEAVLVLLNLDRGARRPDSNPCTRPGELGWHTISGKHLLETLRRVEAGEPADLVYAELWANAEHEPPEDDR